MTRFARIISPALIPTTRRGRARQNEIHIARGKRIEQWRQHFRNGEKLASRSWPYRIDKKSDQTPIERRVAALEREVAELKQRFNNGNPSVNWIERITGSMVDFPEFEDVIRYGREIREADGRAIDQ